MTTVARPKVLICDRMSSRAAQIFTERGIVADTKTGLNPDQLKAYIPEYDGLVIRSSTKVTADILTSARRLRVIGRAGIGVDNIDVLAATAHGIVVMNTPSGSAVTTAEHTLAMMLALARRIPEANASVHAGHWESARFVGTELMGKTLGIVGCGNVGASVAERAQGLKMKVIASDPYLSAERAEGLGVERVDFDTLLARSHFISLHTPITEATRGIINAAVIAKMRKNVYIINCARGELIVEADLKAALDSGHVAGAALDVFAEEPPQASPLLGARRVITTPHLGASTHEAQEQVAAQIAEQMADFLISGAVTNALNAPSVSPDEAQRLRPYIQLARQMGSLAGQTVDSAIGAINIEYQGQVATLNTKALTAVVLEGVLAPLLEGVNMVNAPVVAAERRIDVTETVREHPASYQTLIRITLDAEDRTNSVAGTLFNGASPRVVEIRDIPIDAKLGPFMLYTRNQDRPGYIGALGTALGNAGINIATFHLGRTEAGGEAMALIEVDQPLDDVLLSVVRGLPYVIEVKQLRF